MDQLFEIFGFLIILKDSIKLLPKTWKFVAPIALLSLIIPSIFLLLFNDLALSVARFMYKNPDSRSICMSLLIAAEIFLALLLFKFIDLLTLATIRVSAKSYMGENTLSVVDLYTTTMGVWRNPANRCLRGSRKLLVCLVFLGISLYILIIMNLMNGIIVCAYVFLCLALVVYTLYSSVPLSLAFVVAVVEGLENMPGKNALERAKELVEGQRHHGFLMNLFNRLLLVGGLVSFWIMIGDLKVLDIRIYDLFMVNAYSLIRIFGSIGWTMLYFQCKKRHDEEMVILQDRNSHYTKLLV